MNRSLKLAGVAPRLSWISTLAVMVTRLPQCTGWFMAHLLCVPEFKMCDLKLLGNKLLD